jgi:cyclic beta-1,2-glucan synthetase
LKLPDQEIENPIREDIFSIEKLEEYAGYLSKELKVSANRKFTKPLLPRLKENGTKLLNSYRILTRAIHNKESISPGAEWLVDNFHIVEDQLREINEDLPRQFYKELPKLALGELAGYPRIYGVALALIAHTDSQLETETIRRFIRAFQKITPLSMGELWALAITLRLVLVENLRRFSLRILRDRDRRAQANRLADELIENVRDNKKFQSLILEIPKHCSQSIQIDSPFITQLAKRLRDQDPEHWLVLETLEKHLLGKNSSTELVVHLEHQTQASNQVSVANLITSMRLLSSMGWKAFFESVSLVDQILETDPQGSYGQMDFATRDRYRHVVEKIAKKIGISELSVAKKVVQLAQESKAQNPGDSRRSHVGFYLISYGALRTINSFDRKLKFRFLTSIISHPNLIYFGLASILISLICAVPLYYASTHGSSVPLFWVIAISFFILGTDLALTMTNFILTNAVGPQRLPKLDLSSGVPTQGRSMIVIPCMLSTANIIQELLEKIEIHYLGNKDNQLFFGLLTDFTDSLEKSRPEDAPLLKSISDGIDQLNHKYAETSEKRFFIFHRQRIWNPGEKTWMGRERKRGKLQEFNRLLRGSDDTSYEFTTAPKEFLATIRFVITLDTDTQLPRDSAQKMIGTILHPLNRAHFDCELGRITEGYGVLQPRISVSLESSSKSIFARVFSGRIGVDPYTTAVSDVYQDLFYEGSYTGKGLYDVDAFELALKDRVPENVILSHDLFEGLFAKVALLTDIELFDDYPRDYEAFFKRQHRWIRGDWQIGLWLLPFVLNSKRKWVRNWLPLIARWKILDNLRRSLVAPATFLWLILAWTVFPGTPLFWVGIALFIIVFPCLTYVASEIVAGRRTSRRTSFSSQWEQLKTSLVQALLSVVFLAHQSFVELDAIVRTLYRLLISQANLMEWKTAAQCETNELLSPKPFWQKCWPTEILLICVFILISQVRMTSLFLASPFLFLWMTYPLISLLLNCSPKKQQAPLDESAKRLIRIVARRTWNYFDTFVSSQDNFLPPDNYQEDPHPKIAHRTSPTNMGLYLLSLASARDFGYLTTPKFLDLLKLTLASMRSLERLEGHFLNWYDTETLQALIPKYISTVDSGNLAGCFWAISQTCLDIPNSFVVNKATVDGLKDSLSVLDSEIRILQNTDRPAAEILHCEELLTNPMAASALTHFSKFGSFLKSLMTGSEEIRKLIIKNEHPYIESLKWADSFTSQIQMAQDDLANFAPWASISPSVDTQDIVDILDQNTTFSKLLDSYESALGSLEQISADAEGFVVSLRLARDRIKQVVSESKTMATLIHQLAQDMNFKFLIEKERGVFTIGYNVTDGKRDSALYDLLASESRLASFVAIAKGDVPQEHWFKLGRQLVPAAGGRALISWSGSMFEYLMPLVVIRDYENTLLNETFRSVVKMQIGYGKEHDVPWGVSEAGYNARDLQLNYQYGPFGIPGLGLKRGLSHDLVISPYSTLLAAMINPAASIKNLKHLMSKQLLTKFGFYESIDYTAGRHTENQKFTVIKSFMAHHQGMSLVAINNVVNQNIMQARFHNEPCVKATRLLLQERIPREIIPALPKAAEVEIKEELDEEHHATVNTYVRQYSDPNESSPHVQLLSNRKYSVMISTAGGGYSKCGDRAVTRWSDDATRDILGHFIFVKDTSNESVWSTTYQPMAGVIPQSYKVIFGEEKVEFRRKDGDITTHTEILVAPEDNVEIRHITLINYSTESRTLEVTSYLEPVLASFPEDNDHPAFSKLFIQTEYLAASHTLFAKRRKRSNTESEIWGLHTVVSDSPFLTDVQYETDRAKFIGRGRTILNPIALSNGETLSNSVGATLDPILSLRVQVKLPPGGSSRIAFTTGLASSHQEALKLSDRYHDIRSFDRESNLAWTQSQVDLQHLNIDSETAFLFQRLAERILYSDPSLRSRSHQIAMNTHMQSSLWPHGISGNLPIVVLSISDPQDSSAVRTLLRCHEYLRLKGLTYDFVILDEHGTTYMQNLQDELQQQVRTTGSQVWLNKPGGVFILRSDITPQKDRLHIQAVARVSFFADQPLKEQIDRQITAENYPPTLPLSSNVKKYETQDLPSPQLQFFNDFGGFSEDGREYIIVVKKDQLPPAPWINVIGNYQDFGFQVSETGSGFTWSVNSQTNRLTPWSNDPVSDPPGEIIYLRDEDSGEIWTPTPLPICGNSNYLVKHGQGYSSFEHIAHEFQHTLTLFVPKNETVKISILKLKNLSNKNRKVSVTSYTEWVLGSQREKSAPFVICDIDPESGALFARNPYDDDFSDRIAFADISEKNRTFTCSRKEFLGRNGNYAQPAALRRSGLSQQKGTGQDPCAVLQSFLDFKPGEEQEVIILLGQCDNVEKARELTLRYRNHAQVHAAWGDLIQAWGNLINTVQVKTPQAEMDILMNSWLFYQTLSCRFWSRTAFYQSGGAYGFRDQLQDCMAFIYSAPHLTRKHILRAAGRQFKEGDVQHWWHPPTGRGIRTRISDDLLWLPYIVSFYIKVTGDLSVLTERIPFLSAPLLKPEQEDSYSLPEVSTEMGTLVEHCLRALDHSLPLGKHDLPLIGTGDWNDGLNRVGALGKGESIWLGWFLYKVFTDFLPLCDTSEYISRKERYELHLKKLKPALEAHGWDGEWYLRAYFDDGTPLGSHLNEECKIDCIAQTWAVLSGAGDPTRTALAMKKVKELLIRNESQLVLLLTPPFDKSSTDPGYIRGYVPGVRENGGQYTHAAIWTILAFAETGDGDTAFELFKMLNPVNHSLNKIKANQYKIEPYVLAGDVYSKESTHEGRGGWSWYTGSASWYYRAGLESILGFCLRNKKLSFKPCIPKTWKEYEITYTYGKSKYHIKIENPNGLSHGKTVVKLDGTFMPSSEVELVDDTKDHQISVTLQT